MQAATLASRPAKTISWSGRALSGLIVAFMLFDAVIHIAKPQPVVDAFAQLGYPLRFAVALGAIELICVALYAVPRTAFVGALLLTGYLGGAVATQLRIEAGFPTFFPVILAALLWAGLALRDVRIRALLSQ
jgi:hypothetical protein